MYGQQAHFQADVHLVLVDVAVWDPSKSQPISDLRKSDFVIYDEGAERRVTVLEQGVTGVDVVLLLDVSSWLGASRESYVNGLAAGADSV